MSNILNDRLYSESHEWVKVEGEFALIGISDYAQHEMGDLVYAEAEPVDSELEAGDIVGSIESVKMATDLFTPVAGVIVETNEEIEDSPEKINEDPYGTWIAKIKLADPDSVKNLMDADAYKAMIEG